MDPAALGTLRIGLDAIDAEARSTRRRHPASRRRSANPRLRVAFATLLRRAADALEPRPVGEAAR